MKVSQKLLISAGVTVITLGFMHFIWGYNLIKYEIFNELPQRGKDLILLSTLGLGLCLSIFGILSIYFAMKIDKRPLTTMTYALSQAIFWIIRLVFEILYPIRLRIFVMNNPASKIIIVAIILSSLYLCSIFLIRKKIVTQKLTQGMP